MRASIVIAAHNEGESLWKTVASIMESSVGLDYEIVVADDASDDGSMEEVLRRYPRVRVVRHQQRRGASPTKDLGARDARGEVLVFLDGHTNPQPGAILQLVDDVERVEGRAIVTPTVEALDVQRWRNSPSQVGHGYRLDLETFDCGWLPLGELRQVRQQGRTFYESPALMGCALVVGRALYEELRGFDPHMRFWGVEDLDFGLKCWLMGYSILHDPEAVVGHRFRQSFDNYDVPIEQLVANQLRMARKSFTHSVWSDWLDSCRRRHPGRLAEHPEGLWVHVWNRFEADRASVEEERAYLQARRVRDEFSYAEQFGLRWPRLATVPLAPLDMAFEAMAGAPSASPSPCPQTQLHRYNAGVEKRAGNIIGAKARINTKRALLQCETHGGNWADSSWVWVGAATAVATGPIWAQTGYVRWRKDNETKVNERRYVEVLSVPLNDPNYDPKKHLFQRFYTPYPSGVNEYRCELIPADGEWRFFFNEKFVASFSCDEWKTKTCDIMKCNGEIRHLETQMAGKPNDKVHFTEVKVKVGNNWLKPGFDIGGIFGNGTEWGAVLPQPQQPRDALDIWDKKPPWWPGP